MSRGKLVDKKEIETPFGKVILEKKEYPPFPKRRKIIFWLGGMKTVKLGELITTLHVKPRKSDFEKIKYEPLYYKVKLTDEADVTDIAPYHFLDEEIEDGLEEGFEFDKKEEVEEFIQGLKCKDINHGGVSIGSKTEFERWKKVMEKVK